MLLKMCLEKVVGTVSSLEASLGIATMCLLCEELPGRSLKLSP